MACPFACPLLFVSATLTSLNATRLMEYCISAMSYTVALMEEFSYAASEKNKIVILCGDYYDCFSKALCPTLIVTRVINSY